MPKKRLANLLVERGLAETRAHAKELVLAGDVTVAGRIMDNPEAQVGANADIAIRAARTYVSRGGYKLAGALEAFEVNPEGYVCADIGASTGGFTDVLLQRGAAQVYALDVGYGQLAWKLRQDPRVVVMDRVNVRHLISLPEPIDLVVIDVSFISLELVLPVAQKLLKPAQGEIIALIKPQFEARREDVARGGIVRDPEVHSYVQAKIARFAESQGLRTLGIIQSPITGTEGNIEYLIYLRNDRNKVDHPPPFPYNPCK